MNALQRYVILSIQQNILDNISHLFLNAFCNYLFMSDLDIKEIRKKLGVSQTKLAEMLGVHLKTVQNWEAGRVIPKTKYGILQSLLSNIPQKEINIEEKEKIQDPQLDETPAPGNNDSLIALLQKRIQDLENLNRILTESNNTLIATNKTQARIIERLTSDGGSASPGAVFTQRKQTFDAETLAIKVAELDPIKYNAKLRKRR